MKTPIQPFGSLLYRLGYNLDKKFRSKNALTLPRPVISIGNIAVGGTGKTPLLVRLVHDLKKKGTHPVILTRGYKGLGHRSSPSQVVSSQLHFNSDDVNDEVLLMVDKCEGVPIAVGADRWKAAHLALKNHSVDCFILDDGFQHWPLRRNWDVVCLDATDPWAGGHLLPWGRLREPVTSLKRAHTLVLTRSELLKEADLKRVVNDVKQQVKDAKVLVSRFKFGEQSLSGKRVLAVSAIGNPQAFENNLRGLGCSVVPCRFQDHHVYQKKDIRLIEEEAHRRQALIVTTEKDWVKLRTFSIKSNFVILRAEIEFDGVSEALWNEKIKTFC